MQSSGSDAERSGLRVCIGFDARLSVAQGCYGVLFFTFQTAAFRTALAALDVPGFRQGVEPALG
jgi:hypothetical protein